ncbi:MAG: tandem-95 repeat protein, partial [Acidimicrobiia bacterium]|nr:tandem-95 repeat protein [Acidimicrobiia bacterium]
PPSAPPATQPDVATVDEDGSVVIAVLANDVDPDGDIGSASVSVVAGPSHGVASVSGTSVVYVPDADFSGSDSLQYEACDVTAACSIDDVTVTIAPQNDPPTAVGPGTITIGEDQTVAFDPLADAVDADGDTVTLADFDAVSVEGGTVRLGSLIYTPPADWSGTDTFTYTLTDGTEEVTVTVTVVVTARNDAPDLTVVPTAPVDEGTVGALVATVDVFDVDGDAVTVTVAGRVASSLEYDAAAGGIVTSAPFDFEAAPGHSVFVRATDAHGVSTVRVLTFLVANVNEAPALGESSLEGSIDGASGDVLGFITGSDPDGDSLTFAIEESPPGLVQIDASTGEVRLTGNVPRTPTQVLIRVSVTDPGGLSAQEQFVIDFVDITAPSGELFISPDEVYESLGDGFCPLGGAKVSALANVSDTSGVVSVSVAWTIETPEGPIEEVVELSLVKGDQWAGTLEFGPDTVSKEDQSIELPLLFAVADGYGNVATAELIVNVLNCPG